MKRFSLTKRSSTLPSPLASIHEKDGDNASNIFSSGVASVVDNTSTTALMESAAPPPPPNLKVKRVDRYYSRWSRSWKYKNMGEKVTPEVVPVGASTGKDDPWRSYCFIVVRTLPKDSEREPTFEVIIKSPYLVQACKDVIQNVEGISWIADPVQLDPELLIAFLPNFEEYRSNLNNKKTRTLEEAHVLASVGVLVDYIRKDYKSTIASIVNLTSHGEITFGLLYAIMVPHSLLVATCPYTGEPRALRLVSVSKLSRFCYDMICESIDVMDPEKGKHQHGADVSPHKTGASRAYGKVRTRILIQSFKGSVKIDTLDAYPIKYHHDEGELRRALLARGRKWVSLRGTHHMQYKGTAAISSVGLGGCLKVVRYNVNSRIMVDRETFRRLHPNYHYPTVQPHEAPADPLSNDGTPRRLPIMPNTQPIPWPNDSSLNVPTLHIASSTRTHAEEPELSEEELILASPVLYGFSLSDKLWLEFNVELVSPIEWNDEAFQNLVLPAGRKMLLQSLIEAHNADLGFDDFVQGKGHGLVINLYGPPGVGKTLSAEATSEHVRRPLYVLGSGDLGTTGESLDANLQRIFDIATSWKAIVLIDEADVFLEQRSLHDLERNAIVAVFLRHVEYYRGILFLTTNRVKTFDEAFLSRIHVALHFQELSKEARMQVWRAFLKKVGVDVGKGAFSETILEKLADRNVNGRQIKNATRTANSLAVSRKEPLGYDHLAETLDALDEFTAEFRGMSTARE